MVERWEYKTVLIPRGTSRVDELTMLNGFGMEGWEMVSVFWSGGTWCYFKRPRQPDAGSGPYRSG